MLRAGRILNSGIEKISIKPSRRALKTKFLIPESRISIIYESFRSALLLKPQDLLVAIHRALYPGRRSYAQIARGLHISVGTAHRAMASAKQAQLVTASGDANRQNLVEFLKGGVRYAFFPIRSGGNVRGVPTAASVPAISEHLAGGAVVVWPDPSGRVRGEGLEPLYPTVPRIAEEDPLFYLVLAAIDLLRIGTARERGIASEMLRYQVFSEHEQAHADRDS